MKCNKYSFLKVGAWNIEGAYAKVNNYYVNKVKKIRESIPAIPENTTVLLASFCR